MNSKININHPISMQWKITEDELEEMRNSNDGYLESENFEISDTDVKYYIAVNVIGHPHEQRRGRTHFGFRIIFEEPKEIEAKFTISIDSTDYSQTFSFVTKKECGKGLAVELYDAKNRFIVDDGELVIKVKGFLKIEMDALFKPCILGSFGIQASVNIWNEEHLKDFTIVAGGREIRAHKCFLAARSRVFEAMFKSYTQECKVVIPNFSFEVVEMAIKFCYDSSLVGYVSFNDQMSLLQFFDKYDMQLLKDVLEKHLISEIDESNVCLLANCSLLSNALKLQKSCAEFLQKCFCENLIINDSKILNKYFVFKYSLFNFAL